MTPVHIMKPAISYSPALTVKKALRILEILGDNEFLRPPEVARLLNLSRSNAYRLLKTLEDMEYVAKNEESRYFLTFKMFSLGNAVLKRNRLPELVHEYMIRLSNLSQEVVNLGILHQQKVLYIKKIDWQHYLKLDRPVGETDPLHCTALGKVLLSGMGDQELDKFLRTTKLVPFTKKTILNPKVLSKVIQDVREKGYATDMEELSDGVHCIAAPIRDYTCKVVGAISISGPGLRFTETKMSKLRKPLINATREISHKLGYPGDHRSAFTKK
jgi:IclR family KDG regulon transcriptional repressor